MIDEECVVPRLLSWKLWVFLGGCVEEKEEELVRRSATLDVGPSPVRPLIGLNLVPSANRKKCVLPGGKRPVDRLTGRDRDVPRVSIQTV